MNKLRSLLKGKSVAFVGQGPNIIGKGLGPEIDSHDIVYRTNFFPVKHPDDYGYRCDVISIIKDHIRVLPSIDVPNIITFEPVETDKNLFVLTEVDRLKLRGYCMLHFGLDIIDGTAGMVAWWLCKKYGARIKFYGITGYQDKSGNVVVHSNDWPHYTDWYYDAAGNKETAFAADLPNYDCHNFWNHNKIFRLLLSKGQIDMDPFSLEYFK